MQSSKNSASLQGQHTARSLTLLLEHWADRVTVTRGIKYAQIGNASVTDLVSANDGQVTVKGIVDGSTAQRYRTMVTLYPHDEDWGEIDGNCTCPVMYDCKHAVALLWVWAQRAGVLRDSAAVQSVDALSKAAEPVPVTRQRHLSNAVDAWLNETYAHAEKPTTAAALSASADRVGYTLNAEGILSVIKTRTSKSGAVKKNPQSASLAWIRHNHRMPSYVAEVDEPLLRLLESAQERNDIAPQVRLVGKTGFTLLDMALRSQRAYFEVTPNQAAFETPLAMGEPMAGNLAWADSDAARHSNAPGLRLAFRTQGGDLLSLIATTPPVAIHPQTLRVSLIESALSSASLERLLALPPLAPTDVDAWRFIIDAWKHLPDARHIPPPPVDVPPLPIPTGVLRFALAEITTTQGWGKNARETISVVPAVEINVVYPDGLRMVPQGQEDAAPIEDYVKDGKVVASRLRNVRAERTWALRIPSRLRPLAEVEPALLYSLTKSARQALWALPRHAWSTNDGPRVLADAQEAGFQLEIDPGFPLTLEDIPEPELELNPTSENGWFRFSLGVDIGGVRVDLAPAFARLIGAQQDPDAWLAALGQNDRVLLSLENGKVVRLAGDRVRAMLEPVLAWFQGGNLSEISGLQAALLPAQVIYRGRDLDAWTTMREKLKAGAVLTAVNPAPGFNATLRPYQLSGMAWLAHLCELKMGAVLADDMGLGKTVQTLAHLHREHGEGGAQKPSLIVAPTSVVGNWKLEAEKFAPQVRILIHQGKSRSLTKKVLENADVVITSYPILQRDESTFVAQDWHVIVFDEAQVLKNAKAKTHQAAQALNAHQRLALSGTPMENHLGELWALFNVLSPGLLGNLESFNKHFRHRIEQSSDTERMQTLRARIRPFLLRRTRDAVLTELPEKTETIRWIDLEAGQADLYESLRTAIHDEVRKVIDKKGLKQSTIHILDALLKLRQACCDPRLVKVPGKRDVSALPSAKLDWLMEHVPMLVEEGRRILIFSQFTSMLALIEVQLCAAGIPYVLLTGDTEDRATPIARFQNGEVPVFLLSLKAGGVGLNLTAADTVIHYDPWWNPAVEAQATARAHRIGQDKPVFVYKLIAKGTLEERMIGLLERKQQLASALLDGSAGALAGLTAKDVDDLLAPIESLLPVEK